MRVKRAVLLAALAAAIPAFLTVGVVPAHATFPGTNGRIAFSTDFASPSQIYTMRPDGSGFLQLTHVRTSPGASTPSWSPDGTRISFAKDKHIWVMSSDGSRKTQLSNEDGFRDRQPSWSPDGLKIVFSRCDVSLGFKAYCDIDVMDADGTNVVTLLGGNWIQDHPRYSPDGSKIAFSGNRGGYVCAVWVMDADGSNPIRLTDPAMQANSPDWSPDGTKIVMSSHCKLPGSKVWIMDADGSDPQQLTPQEGDWVNPRFSPDGLTIAVGGPTIEGSKVCCWDLYFMNLDGSNVEPIANPRPGIVSFEWGPKPVAP
jgi:Tol biopolymer transport system component